MDWQDCDRLKVCGTCAHYRLISGSGGCRGCTYDLLLLRVALHDSCHVAGGKWAPYWLREVVT